jgi:FemAB-related protein (PEP-CTERM system-associated)
MSVSIEHCKDQIEWDGYVGSTANASNYHRWAWGQAVEQSFGHEAYYLAARSNGVIDGVLPLVSMKGRFFGHFLVSMPFSSYGGVLAGTSEARKGLLERAVELAGGLGARHIELRQWTECDVPWKETTPKVTLEVELPKNRDELWGRLSSGMRNKVRNAKKHNLQIEWGGSGFVDCFYSVFARNMRDLGTPVYPRRWFENLCCQFPGEIRIVVVRDQGRPVAAGFVILFRDTVEFPWSASLRESRKKYSAVLMYWALLEWALQNGYRRVDLGRCTPQSGTYEFKRHWVCHEKSLHWYYWLSHGSPLPELRRENPRFRLARRLWQRLPLVVANRLGPRIVRAIP